MSTEMSFNLQNASMEDVKTLAKYMAASDTLIPDHLRNNPYKCMAIIFLARRWDLDPWTVAQKTHEIKGILGYEAQLVNAVVSKSKAIKGRFHYEFQGDRKAWKPEITKTKGYNGGDKLTPKFSEEAAVRVGAVIAGEDDITWGEWVYPCDQVVFNSPLWTTNPKQQAGYLAVKFWARWFVPEAILGAHTEDELQQRVERDITPANVVVKQSPLQQALAKKEPETVQEILQQVPVQDTVEEALSDEEKQMIVQAEMEMSEEKSNV